MSANSGSPNRRWWQWLALALASAALVLSVYQFIAGSPFHQRDQFIYQTYSWKEGQEPVRMIHKDEGFCMLTHVGGALNGGGEVAMVYIADDGYWYLRGATGTGFLRLSAVSVKRR
jgi:hypothetical protein